MELCFQVSLSLPAHVIMKRSIALYLICFLPPHSPKNKKQPILSSKAKPGLESWVFSQLPLLSTHPLIQPHILAFLAVPPCPHHLRVSLTHTDHVHTATKCQNQNSNLDSLAPNVCSSHNIWPLHGRQVSSQCQFHLPDSRDLRGDVGENLWGWRHDQWRKCAVID